MSMKYKYNPLLRHPGYNGDFADDVLGFDPNGGGIYDIPIVGDAADAVINSPLGNVVGFVFPPAAPFIYAAKAAQSLASGNELGALLNAVGAYSAYASPTATTTATVGGMDISGINANLVNATNQAIAGGASITDVTKTLVGMGDQKAAADILKQAGLDTPETAEALQSAGDIASNYVPTAADAAESIVAMKEAGFSSADISAQVDNWASVIPEDQIATAMGDIDAPASWAGLNAPISDISTPTWQQNVDSWLSANPNVTVDDINNALASSGGTYDSATGTFSFNGEAYSTGLPDNIVGTPLEPLPGAGNTLSEFTHQPIEAGSIQVGSGQIMNPDVGEYLNSGDLGADSDYFSGVRAPSEGTTPGYWSSGDSSLAGIDGSQEIQDLFPGVTAPAPVETYPVDPNDYITDGYYELTPEEAYDLEYGDLANQTKQSRMLMDQYEGFTQDEVLQHLAGSGIDPVTAEEILAGLGMDEFAVSDYMLDNPTSFGNIYSDPYFGDRIRNTAGGGAGGGGIIDSIGRGLDDIRDIIGTSGGGGGGGGGNRGGGSGGIGGGVNGVPSGYAGLMQQIDPYWDYRKATEIPMMGAAAGTAGKLSSLYQQSYNNPVGVYNSPEMQAVNSQFMQETARRDAALGRNSQYGARGVEAQNNFLTKTLPQYRTGLNQGLQTMYTAAKPQAFDMQQALEAAKGSIDAQNQRPAPSGLAGTVSGLQGSWNQATNGGNVFDRVQGAINTVTGLQDLYTGGQKAYDTISSWFA